MVKNLKKLRLKKGISQQQLADVVGTSQQSINKYENHNIEPDIAMLISFADFFQTSVDYLIGHTEIEHMIEVVHSYDLNNDESLLMDSYRTLTDEQKESIHIVIQNYNKANKRVLQTEEPFLFLSYRNFFINRSCFHINICCYIKPFQANKNIIFIISFKCSLQYDMIVCIFQCVIVLENCRNIAIINIRYIVTNKSFAVSLR